MSKRMLRWLLFYVSIPFGGEFRAKSGTLKCRFLNWIYEGECEPEFPWIWPDEDTPKPSAEESHE